jgi:hypothetical protein
MRERKEDKAQEDVVEFVKWDKLLHSGYRVFSTGQAARALTTHLAAPAMAYYGLTLYLITYCR